MGIYQYKYRCTIERSLAAEQLLLSDFKFSALFKLAALPMSAVAGSFGHFGLFFLFDPVWGCRAHGRRQRWTMETRAFACDPSFLGSLLESGGTEETVGLWFFCIKDPKTIPQKVS